MPEPLEEQLGLDIAPALAAIATLDDALAQVVASFGANLAEALSTALASAAEVPPVEVPVTADLATLESDLATLESEPVPIDVTTNADALQAEVFDALAGAEPAPLNVSADTTAAEAEISALDNEEINVTVGADTGPAQAELSQLGTSAGEAGGGLEALKGSAEGLGIATGLAAGETGELAGALKGIGPGAAAGVAGGVAFTAFLGETIKLAADAQAQEARLNQIFGESKEVLEQVNVGGLNISLEELAKQSGTAVANLDASISKIGLLGTTSGKSQEDVANVAQQVVGLGATLAVQNPRLGDAAAVTDRLFAALQRGGRAASNLGLNIPTKEIAALAQEIAGAGNQVTAFDKLQAGLQLSLKATGDTLGTSFAQGSQNAEVQLRALSTQIEETLVAIGKPLLKPAVEGLKDLLPIAQEVGRALGDLGKVVLPVFAGLALALKPVALAISAFAEGMEFLGPFLPLVALGVVALSLGVDGLAVAIFTAVDAVETFTVALATNPFFLAASAIALVGVAVLAFGSDADGAKEATKAFSEAMFPAGEAAGELADQVKTLDDGITEVVTKFVESKKAGSEFRKALDETGGGVAGVSAALTGSKEDFEKYRDAVGKSIITSNQFGQTNQASIIQSAEATDALDDQRKGLIKANEQQLANLVSSGKLRQDTLDSIEANHKFADGTTDTVAVLKEADSTIAHAAEAQQKLAAATALTTGTLAEATAAFDPATQSVSDYTEKLVQLGLTEADAKKLAEDQVASYTALHDKQLLAAGSATELEVAFATGNATAGELEGGLAGLGISVGAAASEVSTLQSAIDSFAKSATSALPAAGQAVSDFASNFKTALAGVKTASDSGAKAVDSAADAVTKAQDNLNKAQGSASTAQAKQVANARTALATAEANLTRLQQTAGSTAGSITSAQNKVATAQDKLNQAVAGSGTAGAASVKSAQDQLATANKNLADSQAKAATDVKAAQDALAKAADPQRLIDQFIKDEKSIADFQTNLAKLVSEGFGSLAGVLAAKGPEAGGALAAAFTSDTAKARVANAAQQSLAGVTEGFNTFATTNAGALGAAGAQIAAAINAGFAANFAIAHPTDEQIKKAGDLITRAEPDLTERARTAAVRAVIGFEGAFGRLPTITEVRTGEAQQKLAGAQSSLETAGGTVGAAGQKGYSAGLDLGGATGTSLVDAQGKFDAQATIHIATAARAGGRVVGISFGKGFAEGLGHVSGTIVFSLGAAATGGASGTAGVTLPPVRTGASGPQAGASSVTPSTITAAVAAGVAGANAAAPTRAAAVKVDLHKVDVDPFHLANELAWRLG